MTEIASKGSFEPEQKNDDSEAIGNATLESQNEDQDPPPAVYQEVNRFLGMFHGPSNSTGGLGKIIDKFEPEHVGKWIENIDKEDKRDFILKLVEKGARLFYVSLAVGAVAAAAVYFYPKDPKVFMDILKIVVVFSGGVGAGYGVGKKKGDKR